MHSVYIMNMEIYEYGNLVPRSDCLEMNKRWCTLLIHSEHIYISMLQNLTYLHRNPHVQVDLASLDSVVKISTCAHLSSLFTVNKAMQRGAVPL